MDSNTQAAASVSPAQAFTDSAGLTYSAEFVPQSRSRSAGNKEPSINWRVTISKGATALTTDYTQGCAHLPHYSSQFSRIAVYDDAVRQACETGKSMLIPNQKNAYDACQGDRAFMAKKAIPAPALVDVLASLVLDSSVLNYSNFEDWAAEYGYDSDSRAAEKSYRQCLEHALTLRQMIDLDAAAAAFQDW